MKLFKSKRKFTAETAKVENAGEDKQRAQWGNQAEFILSCLGYAMGLGNVWKFPYTCFSNGGGAYLIPYIVVLALIGIPTSFFELLMGQYSGKGTVEVWCLSPIFQGLGLASLLISGMISIFYTMLLAYCLYYFAMCFQSQLPWDTCMHSYNTPACFNQREAKPCRDLDGIWYNNSCFNQTELESEELEELQNITKKLVPSSEEYFFYGVLEKSDGIDQPNGIKMELALCLLAMWIICFLCLIKGIESSGKVVYFTTTFPYVVLTILLIRGAMLDGAIIGIKYYLIPDWKRLADAKVWGDAAGQIFFALGVGAGGLLTYSSYSPFHSNVYRTALTVASANACTDWYAGFVVFSALGYMAKAQNTEVKNVVSSGVGLAFVVYPQVLATLPVPQLWSVLFFFMLILLGIDSLAGFYWLDLISYYSSGWTLVVVGLIEAIVFAWIYGTKKIMAHVKEMVGFKLYPHWWFCWTFITPILLLAVLIFNWISFTPLSWNNVEPPLWVPALGWLMTLSPLVLIISVAIVVTVRSFRKPNVEQLKCCRRFLQMFKPNSHWMPAYKARELKESAQRETYQVKATEENETELSGNMATEGNETEHSGNIATEGNETEQSGNITDDLNHVSSMTTTTMSDAERGVEMKDPPNGLTTSSIPKEDIHLERNGENGTESEQLNGMETNAQVNNNRSVITDDNNDIKINKEQVLVTTTYDNPAFESSNI